MPVPLACFFFETAGKKTHKRAEKNGCRARRQKKVQRRILMNCYCRAFLQPTTLCAVWHPPENASRFVNASISFGPGPRLACFAGSCGFAARFRACCAGRGCHLKRFAFCKCLPPYGAPTTAVVSASPLPVSMSLFSLRQGPVHIHSPAGC